MADEKQMSALFRRSEQLKRWEESETNRVSASVPEERVKVKFQDGCIFLAACSSSDTEEVQKLLDRGADINTANVDGLTALHQACIDDNQEMVEFLVEHNADVDVCDNEGWTPLHATASCGFTEIARYLISKGANLAAVNNDGDLPIDIIEDGDMECLLQKEMDNQGIDPESARNEEEQRMLADANQWLKSKIVKEKKHAKTGASALHVAAAKGYIKVMEILLQAGVDVDAKDHEGWTPLHAASHWAQQESCQILVENMANMDLKNNAGQTAFELADTGMVPILEELKKKQVKLRDKAPPPTDEIIPIRGQTHKRRTSITRMSGDQKANVVQKASERDRAVFDKEDVVTNQSDEENQETERQNEINKKSSTTSPMSLDERPASLKPELSKIVEHEDIETNKKVERDRPATTRPQSLVDTKTPSNNEVIESTAQVIQLPQPDPSPPPQAPTPASIPTPESKPEPTPVVLEPSPDPIPEPKPEAPALPKETVKESPVVDEPQVPVQPPTPKEPVVPTPKEPSTTKEPQAPTPKEPLTPTPKEPPAPTPKVEVVPEVVESKSVTAPSVVEKEELKEGVVCFTSTSASPKINMAALHTSLDRPDSSSLPLDKTNNSAVPSWRSRSTSDYYTTEPSRISQRPVSTSAVEDTKTESRSSGSPPLPPTSGYTSVKPYTSSYIPYYLRQQYQNEQREKKAREGGTRSPLSPTVTTAAMTTSLTSPTTTTTTSVTTPTSTVLKPGFKTYEPPKRDDEAETQRRVKAKRARETRRSTQGVSLEDLKATGEIAISDNKRSERGQEVTSGDQTDSVNSRVSGTIPSGTDDLTSTTTSSYSRRRALEDRTKDEDSTRSTIRRSREAREGLSNSTDYTSSYIPRSQRNALSTSDINNTSSLGGSTNLSRTSSYRSRLRNGEIDSKDKDQNDVTEESRKDKSSSERETADGEKKETSAIRSRRIRRERRSTGIVDYNPEADEGGEKEGKENKTEDNKKDTEGLVLDKLEVLRNNLKRYNLSRPHSGTSNYSTTDSSRYSTRPTSYSEYSRSSTALDTDYKKLYEEEKSSNEKLKKELEQCKQELRDSKKELDRLMKKNSERSDLNSDKREKRALERKVSEMEEELKKMEVLRTDNARLKEENGALIRVISKLSK